MELMISGPEGATSTVELKNNALSLGRSADNDLAYPEDPWLSRYHLCFERQQNIWMVKDCASRNGTVVNATNLREPHRLRPGDRIYAGHLTIEVRDQETPLPPRVISFVPQDEEKSTREATIVTSLDKVLGKAAKSSHHASEATLSTARVVRVFDSSGTGIGWTPALTRTLSVNS